MVVLVVFRGESPVWFPAEQISFVEGTGETCTVHTAFGQSFQVRKRAEELFEEIARAQSEEYIVIPLDALSEEPKPSAAQAARAVSEKVSSS